ncbi:alpha/beta fold hydrolase [Actinosynnema sp. NPDC020468]|uniref:alpha/beta fold hydrolase n=1 Tax=Actinosynnema sp. NPDC020468 TaxID=3154488 RepID=UPI003409B79B
MKRAIALLVAVGASVVAVPAAAQAAPPGVEWRSCGNSGAQCGSVSVPLDWTKPNAGRISVAVARVSAADPARRIGALFINFGGPGAPAVSVVRDEVQEAFPADLRARFDIVGVDPRGVGDSVPAITCPKPPQDPKITQFPRTEEQFQRLVAYNREVAQSCRQATGPLIDHADTVNTAKDFDAVRIALGESKVSWLGLSYGTLLGSTYARLFPNRVRSAVLDGAVDHALGPRRMVADETRVYEDVFRLFAKWCAEDTSCALHGHDVVAEYRALLERAERTPIPAEGIPDGVSAEEIGYAVYSAIYLRDNWAPLAQVLTEVLTPTPNAARFAGAHTDAAYRVIACHDFPSDVRSLADLTARRQEALRLAPVTRGYVEGWDVQAGCAGWPVKANYPWGNYPVRGVSNVLVVGGEHDPSTPLPWAIGLACQIQGSRLIVSHEVGHTAYFNDPATRQREVDHLLSAA